MKLRSAILILRAATLFPTSSSLSSQSRPSISSGYYHTCALEQRQGVEIRGALRCWGQDNHGQASPPPGIFKQVSSGALVSCAIGLDSKAKCWGAISEPQSNLGFSQISAGKSHACGIRTNGHIECWGAIDNGKTDATKEKHQYTQVSCGNSNTCAIRLDGSLECWGKYYGDKETSLPKAKFKKISLGSRRKACGITMQDDIVCWVASTRSEEGDHETTEGERMCCLLSSRFIFTNTCIETIPTPYLKIGPFVQLSTGSQGVCAIRSNRTVACWGQLRSLIPTNSTIQYEAISLGVDHACAINTDDNLNCWHRGPNFGAQEVPLGFSLAL